MKGGLGIGIGSFDGGGGGLDRACMGIWFFVLMMGSFDGRRYIRGSLGVFVGIDGKCRSLFRFWVLLCIFGSWIFFDGCFLVVDDDGGFGMRSGDGLCMAGV